MQTAAQTAVPSPGHDLKALIAEDAKPGRIASLLDDLTHEERVAAVRSLGRGAQKRLWTLVDGFGQLGWGDFVPEGRSLLAAVRHYGRNSLPAFTLFEKRFYRMGDGSQIGGANFQRISSFTGPGYFVLGQGEKAGEVIIDYRRVPHEKPDGWPELQGNERGVSRLVYGFMVDTMRRVSQHVTIGSASRGGKDLGAWFLLCREST